MAHREMTPGQLGFDTDEPWQPSQGCRCSPGQMRGCQHCAVCDRCEDCGRCAGLGCVCACEADYARRNPSPADPA